MLESDSQVDRHAPGRFLAPPLGLTSAVRALVAGCHPRSVQDWRSLVPYAGSLLASIASIKVTRRVVLYTEAKRSGGGRCSCLRRLCISRGARTRFRAAPPGTQRRLGRPTGRTGEPANRPPRQ